MSDKQHNFLMENREKLILSGIRELENFSGEEVNAVSVLGSLKIRGENLEVLAFDSVGGELTIKGRVCSAVYSEFLDGKKVPENFLSKLFK